MRPLRRPPPRHRAPSKAARLHIKRAQAGQTGTEQSRPGHSKAQQPEAQLFEAPQPEAPRPQAQLFEATQPQAQQPGVRLFEAAELEATQPLPRLTKVGQPEVGRSGPEPPKTELPEAGQLLAGQPGGRHVGPALRRLMVTPTFAAGLGVVVAAGLAVSMTSRTVLHFSVAPGRPCVQGCASRFHRSPGAGTPALASPGKRLVPATRGPASSAGTSSPFTGGQGGEDSDHHSGSQVVIDYETTQQWTWGFDGQITISGLTASALSTWRLGFSYPGTRIVEVQGAQWQSTGDDSGVAQAETSGGSRSDSSSGGRDSSGNDGQQNTVVITIEVSGKPGVPSDCRLNDTPCSFR